mgnify:CR=1 FL=1
MEKDLKAFDPQNEKDAEICMIWIALNSVYFWGNDEAVRNHYHLLRKYRTKVVKSLLVYLHLKQRRLHHLQLMMKKNFIIALVQVSMEIFLTL